MQKGVRDLRWVAVYLPIGIDLRLIQDGEIRRTELFSSGEAAVATARKWKR